MSVKAVAFTGMPGAGKSEAVRVAEELGIKIIRMGDAVREEVAKMGMEPTDENLGGIANFMREKYGKDIWARKCMDKIGEEKIVVIDGIRNIEEVETFKKKIDNFILIAIHASPKTRYERIKERGRSDDAREIEKIKEREYRELSWGIGNVIAMADIVIVNEGDLEEFRKKVKELLLSL